MLLSWCHRAWRCVVVVVACVVCVVACFREVDFQSLQVLTSHKSCNQHSCNSSNCEPESCVVVVACFRVVVARVAVVVACFREVVFQSLQVLTSHKSCNQRSNNSSNCDPESGVVVVATATTTTCCVFCVFRLWRNVN